MSGEGRKQGKNVIFLSVCLSLLPPSLPPSLPLSLSLSLSLVPSGGGGGAACAGGGKLNPVPIPGLIPMLGGGRDGGLMADW